MCSSLHMKIWYLSFKSKTLQIMISDHPFWHCFEFYFKPTYNSFLINSTFYSPVRIAWTSHNLPSEVYTLFLVWYICIKCQWPLEMFMIIFHEEKVKQEEKIICFDAFMNPKHAKLEIQRVNAMSHFEEGWHRLDIFL